jgi:hypothetical protein
MGYVSLFQLVPKLENSPSSHGFPKRTVNHERYPFSKSFCSWKWLANVMARLLKSSRRGEPIEAGSDQRVDSL